MKKQHEAIKKFENELLEMGAAAGELEELRSRALRGVNARKGISESRANDNHEEANASNHTEEEEVEDRTREHYDSLLGEVALYQKMLTDHEKQFIQAEEDRQEAVRKNMASRNKLLEC
jgi:hypothetical protein